MLDVTRGEGGYYYSTFPLPPIIIMFLEKKRISVAMWQTPVLCVTLNGKFFSCLGQILISMGRFFDVV